MDMKKNKEDPIFNSRYIMCSVVLIFNTAAFSCCFTAEFHKVKGRDMKMDGSLCSLPKTDAFELGIIAISFMSIAQIVCTIIGINWFLLMKEKSKRDKITSTIFLLSSWITYGLTVVISGSAAGMNGGQKYGKGWMDGDCYVVKNGVFGGAATLIIVNALIILGFTSMHHRHHHYLQNNILL